MWNHVLDDVTQQTDLYLKINPSPRHHPPFPLPVFLARIDLQSNQKSDVWTEFEDGALWHGDVKGSQKQEGEKLKHSLLLTHSSYTLSKSQMGEL